MGSRPAVPRDWARTVGSDSHAIGRGLANTAGAMLREQLPRVRNQRPPSGGSIVPLPTLTGSATGAVTLALSGAWLDPLFPVFAVAEVTTTATYVTWGQGGSIYGRLPVLGGKAFLAPFVAFGFVLPVSFFVTPDTAVSTSVSVGGYGITWPH